MSTSRTIPVAAPKPVTGTGQILATLAKGDPVKFSSFFGRVRQAYPEEVTHIALRLVAQDAQNEPGREMAAWLAAERPYLTLLFDPEFLPLEAARQAIAVMRSTDQKFARKLSRAMEETTDANSLVRALTLMEDIEDYSAFYPRLCTLTWHPDNFIRSKAVLALCRMRPNRSLIDRQLESPDARVRANAVEALWHNNQANATRIFQEALADDHHRVVINALVGLYYYKDESYYEKMVALASHPEARFRAALAWGLGEIREERLLWLLEKLAADPTREVQTRAEAALGLWKPTRANP